MKAIISSLLLTLCGLASVLAGTNTGTALIGLDGLKHDDIVSLAEAYDAAGGDLELAALSFEFNPETPFTNFTKFVKLTLPSLQGTLTITTYLDDGPNRRNPSYQHYVHFS